MDAGALHVTKKKLEYPVPKFGNCPTYSTCYIFLPNYHTYMQRMCRQNMRGRISLLSAYVVPTLAVLPAYCGGQPNSMSGVLFLRPSPTSAGTAKTHHRLVGYTCNHAVPRLSRSLCISLALRLARLLPMSRSSSASRHLCRSEGGCVLHHIASPSQSPTSPRPALHQVLPGASRLWPVARSV